MKTRTWIALGLPVLVAATLVAALPSGAQQPMPTTREAQASPLKIAVINGDRVIAESTVGKEVFDQAQRVADEWQARLEAAQQELDTMIRQGQEQAMTLNQAALNRLNTDIEERRVQLQRMQDDRNRELQRLQLTAQNQINAALVPAVERLAQQEGYDLILDSRITGMLYFSNAIDVTERFLVMVNEQTAPSQQQSQ